MACFSKQDRFEALVRRFLTTMQAGEVSKWRVLISLYKPLRTGESYDVLEVEDSENPGRLTYICGTHIAEATSEFQRLLLQTYALKQRFLIDGSVYRLGGDFLLRLGTVSAGQTAKDVLIMSLEHEPIVTLQGADGPVLELLMDMTFIASGSSQQTVLDANIMALFTKFSLPDQPGDRYGPRHATLMLVRALNLLGASR